MSSSTLQKKVIEFLKKKENINAKAKEKHENENLVSEINEYDEVKETISEDIRNMIREYHQQLDFIPEANIYKIFKKFDFNKIVMDSHVEVILQRSKNIDTADWINVAKKPKKFVKPKIEKKEIVKKFEAENYEGDNEENYQSKKYNEDKYNRYSYPRNYRKRSFNNEFKEDYYYSKRTEYNQKRDYEEEDYIKPKNYESDYPKKRPNYESNYQRKKINYANYEIEYVPKDSSQKIREKSAEQSKERYSHNRNSDTPVLPKKQQQYERSERNEHQNPRAFESNKKYIKKKKFITEITYIPKKVSTDLVAEQPIEKHEIIPEVERTEADEPKIKEQSLSTLKPDPNSDTSTLLQKDKEDAYAEEKPKKDNHRSYPSPKPDVSKKIENTSPNKVEEDQKSVPVINQAHSFLNGNCYQTNSQPGFDATMQPNYFPQIPANYNLQQPPINYQQPLVNNFNNTSVQNNTNAANCPMLCLMMPNGMQIPFPIMMPNQNTNPGQSVNPQDYYFQFLSQIGTMMSGMIGNYNMFGNLPNAQSNPSQPDLQPPFIQKAAEPAKNFSMNSKFQAPNIFDQPDYYLYNPSNFDSYFTKTELERE